MTSGTKTYSSYTPYQERTEYYYPSFSVINSGGPTPKLGTSDVKTWSGTDNPAVPPVYNTYRYSFSISKAHYKTERVDGRLTYKYIPEKVGTREVRYRVSTGKVSPYQGNDLVRRIHQDFGMYITPEEGYARIRRILHVRQNRTTMSRVNQADHPYTMSRITRTQELVMRKHFSYVPPGVVSNTDTQFSVYTGVPAVDSSTAWSGNDDIALIGKLRSKVAGSDFHLGVFLGEGREALSMIADNATRIYQSLKAVKRGDFSSAVRYLGASKLNPKVSVHKTVAQNWLMLQYGWLPLLEDVHGGAQFLAKHLEFPLVQSYKVRQVKKHRVIIPPGFGECSGESRSTGQIIARLSEANVAQMSGLLDPLSVAWELTPWSFVADWFIPIGNYLSARSFVSSLTGTFVTTRMERTTRHQRGSRSVITFPTDYYVESQNGGCSETSVSMQRTVSSSLSVPLPSFKRLSDVPSWKRAANAVSLLVTNWASPHQLSRRANLY